MKDNRKIKVNFVNKLFWLAPPVSRYFRGLKYGYTPYKTLEELVNHNHFINYEFYFSFNALKEKNYDFLNILFRIRNLNFRLNKETVYKIEHQGFVYDESIHELIKIKWDQKSLKWIQKGFIPFYSKEWFVKTFVSSENAENETKIENQKEKENKVEKKIIEITWKKKEFAEVA